MKDVVYRFSISFVFVCLMCLLTTGCSDNASPIEDEVSADVVMLAPSVPPSASTIVWSIWGSTTYHRDTCRFMINTKKPAACTFNFTQKKASEMGLKCCSTCFKAPKVVK
jgi:hypothetical protein